ncbi:MAG: DMT family transporter [Pseudomonadota bacterium]
MLAEWVISIEGTEAGRHWAMALALISACAHAAFGALQKGRHDPWLTRGAIDFSYMVMALPIALFVFPLPNRQMWVILGGVLVIHLIYKILMGMAYQRASYTAVYPVVRGTGPLATVLFAIVVFSESYAPLQWLGIFLLSGGILALAAVNIHEEQVARHTLTGALLLAFAGGIAVAVYTVYDAWGIRQAAHPFTFLAWFFVVDGLVFPFVAYWLWQRDPDRPAPGPLMLRGFAGGLIGFVSFGCVMLATRLDKVGEAAALRETSVVFAALIGWFFLGETVGPRRAALMILIALGAVLVEFG